MAGIGGPAHMTVPAAPLAVGLPDWAVLVRAPNPGPMTLDGTNTWVLRAPGHDGCVVVDPGPLDEGHLAAIAGYAPVEVILITHGHHDHVEGAGQLSEMTGAPVATEPPAGPVAGGLRIARIRTPGHTADSVCFVVDHPESGDEPGDGPGSGRRAVLTGDTILGRGTTVVAWPDGSLGDYLESLARLADLGPVPVLPGHGPPLSDCAAAAHYYLSHRQARLDQVRRVLAAGATTPREVVEMVYRDVDRSLWRYAEWSVRAQLDFLRRESHRGDERLDRP